MPLRDKNCLKEDTWANIGIQGEILMEIREGLVTCHFPTAMDVADSHAPTTSTGSTHSQSSL